MLNLKNSNIMELAIYNSIIHGSLQPRGAQLPDYTEISHLLGNVPETLSEIESRLKQVLGKKLQFNFDTGSPINISGLLNNPTYTHIQADYFPPEILLPVTTPQTPSQRFYYFIVTTEAKRIKLRLLQYIDILKDDICAKQEVKEVLKLLARYAKAIQEQAQPDPILLFLFTQIVKLYFEITLMFDVLLSATDYISFFDFYFSRLNRQADEGETAAYNKAVHIHQAQRLYNTFDAAQAQILLPQLYTDIAAMPTDNILITVTCALENAILLETENAILPDFVQIVDPNFAKANLKVKKQTLHNRLNTISNPREALTEIDNFAETLPLLPAIMLKTADLLTLSIPRQLYSFLIEQKEIYKTNAAQMFIPTTQNEGTKTTKPKATQQKANPQRQKAIALKFINYLSGYNRKNEKILSDDDFTRLTTYICTLIDTGAVPANIQPISHTGTSNEYLRYTFYLIHKELYTTRPVRQEWIELLHAVFTQFQDVDTQTTRKKFSTVPPLYEKDVKDIEKQMKQ
jgi:hypothetical protein